MWVSDLFYIYIYHFSNFRTKFHYTLLFSRKFRLWDHLLYPGVKKQQNRCHGNFIRSTFIYLYRQPAFMSHLWLAQEANVQIWDWDFEMLNFYSPRPFLTKSWPHGSESCQIFTSPSLFVCTSCLASPLFSCYCSHFIVPKCCSASVGWPNCSFRRPCFFTLGKVIRGMLDRFKGSVWCFWRS